MRAQGLKILGLILAVTVSGLAGISATAAEGDAIVSEAACTATDLTRNDDGSSPAVPLPFDVNFYGQTYDQLWVNNNGNITFDAPLSTYTPFGLAETNRVIIAPFFADVDTRGSGSDIVRYGYGTTTYEGHPAFCVNWLDVGYFSGHYDKLNSFQLLLVDRSDREAGEVDVVFNYGKVQWETGDASGGSGGMGGSPARVGFSNGTGAVGTNFELVGSHLSQAFLDSNTATGLVHNSIGSDVDGRYVFEVNDGRVPPQTWVAMGDSYQSGVGTGDYYPESGECQRSQWAYPLGLLFRGAPLSEWGMPVNNLEFVACSGATTDDLRNGRHGEDPQFSRLEGDAGKDVGLVTIGIGGNDLGFAKSLSNCIRTDFVGETCEDEHGPGIDSALETLTSNAGGGLSDLQEVYRDIRFKAYRAKTRAITYPKFFPKDGGDGWFNQQFLSQKCNNIRVSDQLWMNGVIRSLDDEIVDAALTMGVEPVDIYNASASRELCNDEGNDEFLNGATLDNGRQDSFHPTRLGHEIIADHLSASLANSSGSTAAASLAEAASETLRDQLVIHPDETVTRTFIVPADAPAVGFSTAWPGSDVTMSLKAPSGREVTRSSTEADVLHELAPTRELFYVRSPEPGEWTIELHGTDVAGSGEDVELTAHASQPENAKPTAAFDLVQNGRTVSVDGRGSSDSDGSLIHYIWEFDDGTIMTGPTASYTYSEPGEYRVTLTVVDNREAVDVENSESEIVISTYDFTGFAEPVEAAPTVNQMQAGRAIPLKFGLGGDYGLDVLADGSPTSRRVDCETGAVINDVSEAVTTGSSGLQYDATTDRYTYVWATSKSWAGQCREFEMVFDDGSRTTLLFRFR